MPVIWFADRGVERFVVDVEDSTPLLGSNRGGGGQPLGQQPLDEVVHLLAMSDAREGAVLAADKHAGMQHYCHEELGLTVGETERRNGFDSVGIDLPKAPLVRHLNVHP